MIRSPENEHSLGKQFVGRNFSESVLTLSRSYCQQPPAPVDISQPDKPPLPTWFVVEVAGVDEVLGTC